MKVTNEAFGSRQAKFCLTIDYKHTNSVRNLSYVNSYKHGCDANLKVMYRTNRISSVELFVRVHVLSTILCLIKHHAMKTYWGVEV